MKGSASESKPFQRRNSQLSQAGRTAEPLQIQIAVLKLFTHLSFKQRVNEMISIDSLI